MYGEVKEKGYARITTNLGNINVELWCDKAPRTCHNFVLLAKQGYYKGVGFHRSIKNFMVCCYFVLFFCFLFFFSFEGKMRRLAVGAINN